MKRKIGPSPNRSMAAANDSFIRPVAMGVLSELLMGQERLRQPTDTPLVFHFDSYRGKLTLDVRSGRTGAHFGSWAVSLRCL